MENKMVPSPAYIENVWLRVVVAVFAGLAFGLIVGLSAHHNHLSGSMSIFGGGTAFVIIFGMLLSMMSDPEVREDAYSAVSMYGGSAPSKGNLNFVVRHSLAKQVALAKIRDLLLVAKKEHAGDVNITEEIWNEDGATFALSVRGHCVRGSITVRDGEVEINGQLPFPASLFKGKIRAMIEEQARLRLA